MRFSAPLTVLLALSVGTPAFAHAFLAHASPPVGSTVAQPPPALVLRYTEDLEVPFCTVQVTDAAGASVESGKPQAVAGHADEILVKLHITAPGTYKVSWTALSVDTHHTEGHFTFTVGE